MLHLLERADRFFNRNFGIDGVQLIQIDPLQTQPLQTSFYSLFKMVRSAIWHPLAGSRPSETAFCRDNESFRIRMEGFCYQQFARVRPVRIGCVDQIDAQLGRASENLERVRSIWPPPPTAFPGDTPSAKTKPVHGQIAAEFKSCVHSHVWCGC